MRNRLLSTCDVTDLQQDYKFYHYNLNVVFRAKRGQKLLLKVKV